MRFVIWATVLHFSVAIPVVCCKNAHTIHPYLTFCHCYGAFPCSVDVLKIFLLALKIEYTYFDPGYPGNLCFSWPVFIVNVYIACIFSPSEVWTDEVIFMNLTCCHFIALDRYQSIDIWWWLSFLWHFTIYSPHMQLCYIASLFVVS